MWLGKPHVDTVPGIVRIAELKLRPTFDTRDGARNAPQTVVQDLGLRFPYESGAAERRHSEHVSAGKQVSVGFKRNKKQKDSE